MGKIQTLETGFSLLWKGVGKNSKINPQTLRYIPKTNISACTDTFVHSMPSELSSLLKDIKNPEIINLCKQLSNKKVDTFQIEDIIRKFKMCEDKKVQDAIIRTINNGRIRSKADAVEVANKIETILDSVNVAEGKYSPLFNISYLKEHNERQSALEYIKQKKEELQSAILNNDKNKIQKIKSSIVAVESNPRAFFKASKEYNQDIWQINRYYFTSKFDKIKELLIQYPEERELGKYLWKKYFIPYAKSPQSGRDIHTQECLKMIKEIEHEFGAIVFFDGKYYATTKGLQDLKRELITWKIASKRSMKYPIVFDFTKYQPIFANPNIAGVCDYGQKYVACSTPFTHTIRHELAHSVDKKTAEGEDALIEFIIPEKFVAEMQKNVQSPDFFIPYARKGNKNEWKAISIGEADARKFTPEYRQELEDAGMPKYALNLMSHAEAFESLLRKKYDQTDIIDKIKESLNGELPVSVSEELLKHPQYIQKAKQIIGNNTFENGMDFLSKIKS